MLAVRWKMLFNKLAFHAFCNFPTLLELVVAHFVVTLVSAIVRKLALKEAERFGSNESAYLTCLCVTRAQIPPIFLKLAGYCARLHRFILQHSSQKVRIRMSCSKRCKANYLWEPQRVCVCVRALLCARYNTCDTGPCTEAF
jgi:hypothetical protein